MLRCSSPFRALRATRLGALAVSAALAAGCQDGSDPLASTTSPDARTLAKKGVGTWSFAGGSRAMADVGVSWFYTWRVDHQWEPAPPGVELVPMIGDETHANTDAIAQAAATGTDVLLGYNEPDRPGQANMTYAWFALPPWSSRGVLATTNLDDDAGAPTTVGEGYRSLAAAADREAASVAALEVDE